MQAKEAMKIRQKKDQDNPQPIKNNSITKNQSFYISVSPVIVVT